MRSPVRTLICAGIVVQASTAAPAAPTIVGQATLSALPEALAQGDSGPVNRLAFDLGNVAPGEAIEVRCLYGTALAYRCRADIQRTSSAARTLRVLVEVPDLDLGPDVVVRFITPGGRIDSRVRIVNRPHVYHEIESVALRNGGRTVTDGSGKPTASLNLAQHRATTLPTAAWDRADTPACGRIQARWVSATASDPVFTSNFGAMNGSVLLAQAPAAGSDVAAQNAPEWLITYPQGATRVQFIAHYEVAFRVTVCRELTVSL